MTIKISKHYEENVKVSDDPKDFRFAKVGITLHSDKELKTRDEIKEHSTQLHELAKRIVSEELENSKQ